MHYLKLVFKNIFRHKLRSLLTLAGLVVAILAFGLLQTVVNAWYAGSDMASAQRLISRNATSLVFPLPITYRDLVPRRDLAPALHGLARAAVLLLLLARMTELRRWA